MLQLKWLAASLAVCALIGGCGGGGGLETVPVKGKVLYNGEPLPYGSISFQPSAGSPATGKIQSDGSFTLTTYKEGDGAVVGQHKVLVFASEIDAGTAPPPDPNEETPPPKSVIPQKYTSFSTSGLTAEVEKGGDNTFTFEIND